MTLHALLFDFKVVVSRKFYIYGPHGRRDVIVTFHNIRFDLNGSLLLFVSLQLADNNV